jgi:hypothetical protein
MKNLKIREKQKIIQIKIAINNGHKKDSMHESFKTQFENTNY